MKRYEGLFILNAVSHEDGVKEIIADKTKQYVPTHELVV